MPDVLISLNQCENSLLGKNFFLFLAFVIVIACNDIIPRDYMKGMLLLRISFVERVKRTEMDVLQHHHQASSHGDVTYLTETSHGSIHNVNSCRIPNKSEVKPN